MTSILKGDVPTTHYVHTNCILRYTEFLTIVYQRYWIKKNIADSNNVQVKVLEAMKIKKHTVQEPRQRILRRVTS